MGELEIGCMAAWGKREEIPQPGWGGKRIFVAGFEHLLNCAGRVHSSAGRVRNEAGGPAEEKREMCWFPLPRPPCQDMLDFPSSFGHSQPYQNRLVDRN